MSGDTLWTFGIVDVVVAGKCERMQISAQLLHERNIYVLGVVPELLACEALFACYKRGYNERVHGDDCFRHVVGS